MHDKKLSHESAPLGNRLAQNKYESFFMVQGIPLSSLVWKIRSKCNLYACMLIIMVVIMLISRVVIMLTEYAIYILIITLNEIGIKI